MAAHCLCKILYVLYMTPLLCSNSQHSKVCLACALETGDSHNMPVLERNISEGSLFGKTSFMQGYRLLISAKEKEHHYPH